MKYHVEFSNSASKQFGKLDNFTRKIIISWIYKNLEECEDPRSKGKPLKGDKKDQWRYRIGDYRIIAKIEDNRLIILIIKIGHRREIYK